MSTWSSKRIVNGSVHSKYGGHANRLAITADDDLRLSRGIAGLRRDPQRRRRPWDDSTAPEWLLHVLADVLNHLGEQERGRRWRVRDQCMVDVEADPVVRRQLERDSDNTQQRRA